MIPINEISGLRPKTWICVGPGYSREELKSILLQSGTGFVSEAVTTVEAIAARLAAFPKKQGFLQSLRPLARQEVLRILLSDSRISNRMPELKRLRRQSSFFRRVDQAIQAGRMAFSHAEEAQVYEERLESRFGENPVRKEIQLLAQAYEAWLEGMSFADPPWILKQAIEKLQSTGWPSGLALPEKILYFSIQEPESLERTFLDLLGRYTQVSRSIEFLSGGVSESPLKWNWELWHTPDDASERLAEALLNERDLKSHVVLIPDSPPIRRSLKRVLRAWGIPEADPRDPMRLNWDEGLKWAFLPLQVVARDFERDSVIAWMKFARAADLHWHQEVNFRGVRQGLGSYEGGKLTELHAELQALSQSLGGRKTCAEIAKAHLTILKESAAQREVDWVVSFFEEQWNEFQEDWAILGLASSRAPLLYWLDKLQNRVGQAAVPVEQQRPSGGLRVYRLQQAPLESLKEKRAKKLWILGLSSGWLSGQGMGDYWFGEREREVLSTEFAVRSGIQAREERLSSLKAWLAEVDEVTILDSRYSSGGRELESILPLLGELGSSRGVPPEEPEEMGAHSRWVRSYGAIRPLQPQKIKLPPLSQGYSGEKPEISATVLERYSKCSFQSLAMDRWKVRDIREPDCELWPDVRGIILHEAVKILLQSWTDDSGFTLTVEQALERAWKLKPPQGWIRSPRVLSYLKSRMLHILKKFCEKEEEYKKRSKAQILSLDQGRLRIDYPGFAILGTPDRIDQTDDGLFLMDYKTSSSLPNGSEMIELGYRLQLPFYALAASKSQSQPVLGVQFIELGRRANRGNGIFFKRYNGKEAGKLTTVTQRSKSLVSLEPEEAWQRLETHLVEHATAYVQGQFAASPKKPDQECVSCSVGDLCGYRRRVSDGIEGGLNGD